MEANLTEPSFAVGEALRDIRRQRLYRRAYPTFGRYCRER
jgi:hypothetical protein